MGSGNWEQSLTDGRKAVIEAKGEHRAESYYTYHIRLMADAKSTNSITPTGAADVTQTKWMPGEQHNLHLSVNIPTDLCVERLRIKHNDSTSVIYLPSKDFLDACKAVQIGDENAVQRVLNVVDSPVQLPIICGAFLPLTDVLDLLDTITHVSRSAASYLHSYRYGLVRASITSKPGLTVESLTELETLITGLDSIAHIGPVDLIDSLGDIMGTLHQTPTDTDALFDSLDINKRSLERQDDGFILLSYLSFFLSSRNLEAAEGYAMKRNWRTSGNYKRRVIEAQNADFPDRSSAWRSLVCAAARHGRHEFAYILANACYWSAKTRQTDSRVTELLYRGAIEAASEISLDTVEMRAKFGIHFDIAHRLRSSHNFKPALTHFEKAEQLTDQYQYLPAWRARYSRGICESHAFFNQGNIDESLNSLDETIDDLLLFEIAEEQLTEAIHHIKAQKHEKRGDSESAPETSVEHYETAINHYEIIGFDRSTKRCERKTDEMKTHLPESSDERTQTPESTSPHASTMSDQTSTSDVWGAPISEPLPPKLWAAETGQYPAHRDEEQIPSSEAGEVGSRDPGQIPDEDESIGTDDPYIF